MLSSFEVVSKNDISTSEKDPLPWTATQSPYLFRMSKEG